MVGDTPGAAGRLKVSHMHGLPLMLSKGHKFNELTGYDYQEAYVWRAHQIADRQQTARTIRSHCRVRQAAIWPSNSSNGREASQAGLL